MASPDIDREGDVLDDFFRSIEGRTLAELDKLEPGNNSNSNNNNINNNNNLNNNTNNNTNSNANNTTTNNNNNSNDSNNNSNNDRTAVINRRTPAGAFVTRALDDAQPSDEQKSHLLEHQHQHQQHQQQQQQLLAKLLEDGRPNMVEKATLGQESPMAENSFQPGHLLLHPDEAAILKRVELRDYILQADSKDLRLCRLLLRKKYFQRATRSELLKAVQEIWVWRGGQGPSQSEDSYSQTSATVAPSGPVSPSGSVAAPHLNVAQFQ
ncbi:unnamed protein product [Polarella glacialis]|uniref:Uncharacterized protein n=1 Tax=Polarella glacialis TaxID=89957 RepID=A0A813DDP7_POLGL|nr:unnamed protein product [Polarella glacialis]